MQLLHVAAAVAIGVSLSLQPPINASMARTLGSPMLAACVSIAISMTAVLALWATWAGRPGDLAEARTLPWWVVLGGLAGVVFVAGSIVVSPVLGVASFFVFVVAGQLLGAALTDQTGAFGAAVRPMDPTRLLGLVMVLAGAALVQRSGP